jgi:hypothetical protein
VPDGTQSDVEVPHVQATSRPRRVDRRGRPRSGRLRAGPNIVAQANQPDAAGFWLGLWQGLISPITFVISLFNEEVNIYEVNNNGNWYDFGFMLGVAIAFSGPAGCGGTVSRRSRSRR